MTKFHQSLKNLALIFIGSLILSAPSLYNQYPFLYFDSGFYLLNSKFFSADWLFLWRPLTYSFFLQVNFLLGSLLAFAWLQNFLVSSILYFATKDLFSEVPNRYFLGCIFFLFLTPLPFFSNFIIPDVYTGLLVVIVGWYFCKPHSKRAFKFSSMLVFSAVHQSNLLVMAAYTLWSLINKSYRAFWRPLLVSTILLPLLLIPVLHGYFANTPSVSNATHALIYSRLMTYGLAQNFLDEKCPQDSEFTVLCQRRDLPFHIWDWSPESQIGALGGLKVLEPEFRKLNFAILKQPQNLGLFFMASTFNVIKQWVSFSTPLVPSLGSAGLNSELLQYSQAEHSQFTAQKIKDWSTFETYGTYFYFFTMSILALALGLLMVKRRLDKRIETLLKVAILYYFLNGLFCGLLTDPLDRYSARIIWIFGFLFFLQLSLWRINKTTETV